jgi:hypothetical protein
MERLGSRDIDGKARGCEMEVSESNLLLFKLKTEIPRLRSE